MWDNDIQNRRFRSNESDVLVLVEHGRVLTEWTIEKCETFTVEVEEEITEDTVLEDITVVCKINSRDETRHFYYSTLKDIKKAENLLSAYIPINGNLELIWEAK